MRWGNWLGTVRFDGPKDETQRATHELRALFLNSPFCRVSSVSYSVQLETFQQY